MKLWRQKLNYKHESWFCFHILATQDPYDHNIILILSYTLLDKNNPYIPTYKHAYTYVHILNLLNSSKFPEIVYSNS